MNTDKIGIYWFFILIFLIILNIFGMMYYTMHYKIYYSYIDLDNNEGIAIRCQYSDKGSHSGGMGSPICILDDNTVLSVKSYKIHREKVN